jgi:hypothetical protein
VYLGDGYVSQHRGAFTLRVFLHKDQLDVIERVCGAMSTVLPSNRVTSRLWRGTAVVVVRCYSPAWPVIFPQHGPGRKHTRAIRLEGWQERIVREHPRDFILGCIDSDGCRHRRLVRGRNDPAYSFSPFGGAGRIV